MDTALTIITDALLDLGVLADEETPSPSQAQGALRKLNNMIDDWNTQNLMVYGSISYVLPFVAGKQKYTIGPGGDFDIERPSSIDSAFVRNNQTTPPNILDTPLYQFTDEEWQNVPLKAQTATYPYWGIWFNYGNALIEAYLNPIPSAPQYSLVLWIPGMFSSFKITDNIILAPGYKRALTANLSMELAAQYGVTPAPTTVQIAGDSKANIKVSNFQLNRLATPGAAQYDAPSNRIYIR